MARNSIIGWIVKKLKGNMALVEDSTTASQNISANKYVVFQGILCTADAAISQGDTLATSGAGKNLTEVTGGGFNELNDHIAKKINIAGLYEGNMIAVTKGVSFTNGVGSADLSDVIPTGYKIAIPLAIPSDTSTLYITGCAVNSNTELIVKCTNTYTGTTSVNIFATIRTI